MENNSNNQTYEEMNNIIINKYHGYENQYFYFEDKNLLNETMIAVDSVESPIVQENQNNKISVYFYLNDQEVVYPFGILSLIPFYNFVILQYPNSKEIKNLNILVPKDDTTEITKYFYEKLSNSFFKKTLKNLWDINITSNLAFEKDKCNSYLYYLCSYDLLNNNDKNNKTIIGQTINNNIMNISHIKENSKTFIGKKKNQNDINNGNNKDDNKNNLGKDNISCGNNNNTLNQKNINYTNNDINSNQNNNTSNVNQSKDMYSNACYQNNNMNNKKTNPINNMDDITNNNMNTNTNNPNNNMNINTNNSNNKFKFM